MINLKVAERK